MQKFFMASWRSSYGSWLGQTHGTLNGVSPQPSARLPLPFSTVTQARATVTDVTVSSAELQRQPELHREKIEPRCEHAYVSELCHLRSRTSCAKRSRSAYLFCQVVYMTPVEACRVFAGFEPMEDLVGAVVVIAGNDLAMAAIRKPLEAISTRFSKYHGTNDHVLIETFPRAFQVAAHEVVIFVGVVVRVEHVAPHVNGPAGIDFAQNFHARPRVVGEERAGIEISFLAGEAPVEHADFVVGHHVALRAPRGVHALCLVAQQLDGLRLRRADHGLVVVHGDGVVVRDAQARAVGQLRLDHGRLVVNVVRAFPWLDAHVWIANRLVILSFGEDASASRSAR